MLAVPVDEVTDPHMHLFDLRGTPRPMQPLGKYFGWNERVLRAVAKRAMPDATVAFFGERTPLLGDYLPPHFRADSEPFQVARYVHVQAGWTDKNPFEPVGETVWLDQLDDPPAGIVGHADLSLGADVAPILRAHQAASPRFRGIRHILASHPAAGVMDFCDDPKLASRDSFRAGVAMLADHDLTFDAWCYGDQLRDLADLAAVIPDVNIVLCHAGTPVGFAGEYQGVGVSQQERARIGDEWRDGISAVAANPNVWCKLSGLLMPVLGFGYERASSSPTSAELAERLAPLVDHCIDAFGPERCMFASNFPVDRVSVSYEAMFRAILELTHRYGEDAQRLMLSDVAATFYRL